MDNKKYSLWSKLKNTNTVLIALINAILLIVVDNYNPTSYFTQQRWMIAAAVIGVVTIFWIMYVTNFWKLVKLRNINTIDLILASIVITSLSYRVYLFYTHQLHTWKFDVIRDVFGVALTFLIFREIYVHVYDKPEENKNTIDLRELYEGKADTNTYPIIINDRAVNYDLLDRETIISILYDAIVNTTCHSNAYVIGLDGKWGTGKTTIINIVKQRLNKENEQNDNIHIVKNFDFWTTGSQTAILNSMYDALLKAIGVDYSSVKIRKLLKRTANFMTNMPKVGKVINQIINENITQEDVDQLKDNLKELILSSNKRYVFFVDDLDRANSSQVLFLLKMLGTVFNLPNLIFVLLYDKQRMKKIISNEEELNIAFVEKIINQEIRVPEVSEKTIQGVYKKGLNNLATAYGVNSFEIEKLAPAIDRIVKQIKNIRDLKRVMNSVCNIAFSEENTLNREDSLLIEFIHFEEPGLYELISNNREYFISQDCISFAQSVMQNGNEASIQFWNEITSNYIKEFYENNLERYDEYSAILGNMFPYVKSYYASESTYVDSTIHQNELKNKKRQEHLRICSGNYFDLYFSLTQNDYSKINSKIQKIVRSINISKSEKEVARIYDELINWDKESLRLGIIDLGKYTTQINPNWRTYLSSLILHSVKRFSSTEVPNLRLLLLSTCSILLKKSKLEEVSQMLYQFENKYDLLGYLNILSNYVEDDDKLQKLVMQIWCQMCETVWIKHINLYSDENYEVDNAWGLYNYVKQDHKFPQDISNYLNQILSEKNIYRILFDSMIESIGPLGYGYQVGVDYYNIMDLDHIPEIKMILDKKKPINESQKRVYDIYEKYMHDIEHDEQYYKDPINPRDL